MRKREGTSPLVAAAIWWWKGRRPLSFSEKEHLATPTINTSNDREKRLAREVAAHVRSKK